MGQHYKFTNEFHTGVNVGDLLAYGSSFSNSVTDRNAEKTTIRLLYIS